MDILGWYNAMQSIIVRTELKQTPSSLTQRFGLEIHVSKGGKVGVCKSKCNTPELNT